MSKIFTKQIDRPAYPSDTGGHLTLTVSDSGFDCARPVRPLRRDNGEPRPARRRALPRSWRSAKQDFSACSSVDLSNQRLHGLHLDLHVVKSVNHRRRFGTERSMIFSTSAEQRLRYLYDSDSGTELASLDRLRGSHQRLELFRLIPPRRRCQTWNRLRPCTPFDVLRRMESSLISASVALLCAVTKPISSCAICSRRSRPQDRQASGGTSVVMLAWLASKR